MSFDLSYDSISKRLVSRVDISTLSGRDKINLFQALMEELGITARLHEESDATARAQQLMVEQWDKHWDSDAQRAFRRTTFNSRS